MDLGAEIGNKHRLDRRWFVLRRNVWERGRVRGNVNFFYGILIEGGWRLTFLLSYFDRERTMLKSIFRLVYKMLGIIRPLCE